MTTISANQILTSRSIGDYNCIFRLSVLERKGNFATVKHNGEIKKVKVRIDVDGNEYLKPDNYSMAPIFRSVN